MQAIQARMQDFPLTLHHVLWRMERLSPRRAIVTHTPAGTQRTTHGEVAARVHRLAYALAALGVQPGDRVATLAWSNHRHLELYCGVPCIGAVLHTLNLRLSPDQLAFIVNDAGDSFVSSSTPVAGAGAGRLPRPHPFAAPGRGARRGVRGVARRRSRSPRYRVTELLADERTPSAHVLHLRHHRAPQGRRLHPPRDLPALLGASTVDVLGICERDVILHIVPMFHANAWCVPFAAGDERRHPDLRRAQPAAARHHRDRARTRRSRWSARCPRSGSPSRRMLEKEPQWDISSIRCIPIGGSAAPRTLIELFDKKYGGLRCSTPGA